MRTGVLQGRAHICAASARTESDLTRMPRIPALVPAYRRDTRRREPDGSASQSQNAEALQEACADTDSLRRPSRRGGPAAGNRAVPHGLGILQAWARFPRPAGQT